MNKFAKRIYEYYIQKAKQIYEYDIQRARDIRICRKRIGTKAEGTSGKEVGHELSSCFCTFTGVY